MSYVVISMFFAYNVDNLGPLETVETSFLLEKNGFDSIWLADHLTDVGGAGLIDPWAVGGAIATQTRDIQIFSAVTDTQRCHPAKTAHIVANLDVLSKGRTGLGIGAGEAMNTIPFGIEWENPSERILRLKEAIEIINLLWSSSKEKPANYRGKFYNLYDAYLDLLPHKKPRPPIFVGALSSRKMLSLIGELADGWIGWLNTPEAFKKKVEIIRISAEKAKRKIEEIQLATMVSVAFPKDDESLKELVKKAKSYLLIEQHTIKSLGYKVPMFPHYQNFLVSKNSEKELAELAEDIPEELVYRCIAFGEERCIEMIDELKEAGTQQVAVINIDEPYRAREVIERFKKIIQYFRSK